ncbi:helix-turn-helix domain-containing protein [Enterococcus sp. BWR-S5]|uniref:helix-turn-helix domain-containing protein n=1 Tax=Enterococcus sp. BWR-S5 TaxID=2787714 RepID=UPI001924FAED|nr:helix-turn-helix transcriptional regulator [Enterococcus sp. BWR-S5]MBL1225409.1 helix-turn-helix transcriptional regulator [Enterococcus sp. BWR-S5]
MSENLDIQIRTELRKRKMTFTDLAKLLDISKPYLSDIVNGRRDGKKAKEYIIRIKYILGIE